MQNLIKSFVLDWAKTILQNNNMKFNKDFYKQIKGKSMGAIFAPHYPIWSVIYLKTGPVFLLTAIQFKELDFNSINC